MNKSDAAIRRQHLQQHELQLLDMAEHYDLAVKVYHSRYVATCPDMPILASTLRKCWPAVRVDPRGGCTEVVLWGRDDICMGSGAAVCSRADNFNKRVGRVLALKRAMKDYLGDRYREGTSYREAYGKAYFYTPSK